MRVSSSVTLGDDDTPILGVARTVGDAPHIEDRNLEVVPRVAVLAPQPIAQIIDERIGWDAVVLREVSLLAMGNLSAGTADFDGVKGADIKEAKGTWITVICSRHDFGVG